MANKQARETPETLVVFAFTNCPVRIRWIDRQGRDLGSETLHWQRHDNEPDSPPRPLGEVIREELNRG